MCQCPPATNHVASPKCTRSAVARYRWCVQRGLKHFIYLFFNVFLMRSPLDVRAALWHDTGGACDRRLKDFIFVFLCFFLFGLPQMYAQRYGTIPVVHATGGLKDSVIQYNPFDTSAEGVGTGW